MDEGGVIQFRLLLRSCKISAGDEGSIGSQTMENIIYPAQFLEIKLKKPLSSSEYCHRHVKNSFYLKGMLKWGVPKSLAGLIKWLTTSRGSVETTSGTSSAVHACTINRPIVVTGGGAA